MILEHRSRPTQTRPLHAFGTTARDDLASIYSVLNESRQSMFFSATGIMRAPPHSYLLWGSAAEQQPSADFQRDKEAVAAGWQLIAWVDTRGLGYGGVSSRQLGECITRKTIGPFRHLLWITERMDRGTFFDEIDVHAAPDD